MRSVEGVLISVGWGLLLIAIAFSYFILHTYDPLWIFLAFIMAVVTFLLRTHQKIRELTEEFLRKTGGDKTKTDD